MSFGLTNNIDQSPSEDEPASVRWMSIRRVLFVRDFEVAVRLTEASAGELRRGQLVEGLSRTSLLFRYGSFLNTRTRLCKTAEDVPRGLGCVAVCHGTLAALGS